MSANPAVEASSSPSKGVGTVIGLDIGGTKTHGARFENGTLVLESTTGSANVQNVNRETARANLAQLFEEIGQGDVEYVYAGAGGIDTTGDAQALKDLLAPFAPHANIIVVHDSRLLLAAGLTTSGVAVIAGTGSAVWGRNPRGDESRAGGWGYLLGDEGSGYWLGREAVRHSLRRMNQGHPPDALTKDLLADCKLDHTNQLIALFHAEHTGRRYWAQRARVVIGAAEKGHRPSQEMIDQAGRDLAQLTLQALSQLNIAGPVILGGGLGMNVGRLQSSFREALTGEGINDVRIVDRDPIMGVTHLMAELEPNRPPAASPTSQSTFSPPAGMIASSEGRRLCSNI